MKIQTLEYFLALAQSRSINEAAQKLYISQPSLTKALRSMEEELGVALFLRTKSGIALTDAGRRMLPEARQVVEYYEGWQSLGHEAVLSEMNVYCHASLSGFLLTDILWDFRERYPRLAIHYSATMGPEAYTSRDLRAPAITLSMYTQANKEKYTALQGNEPLSLAPGEWRCLVRRDSELGQKQSVSFKDLKEYFFVLPMMNRDAYFLSISDPIAAITAEVGPQHVLYVEAVSNVIDMVQRHSEAYALSYYPALMRYPGVARGELVSVPFRDYDAGRELCLFYSHKASRKYPILAEFVDAVQRAALHFLEENDENAPLV